MTTASPVLTPRPIEPATLSPRPMEAATPTEQPIEPAATQNDRPATRTIVFGNLELRLDEMQALVEGARIGLTVREFQVLAVLADRADRVVRRPEIYRGVWGGEMKHRDRAVDVFVRKVRTKLLAAAPEWAYIHTHFGIGYRFAPEPDTNAERPDADAPEARRFSNGPATSAARPDTNAPEGPRSEHEPDADARAERFTEGAAA